MSIIRGSHFTCLFRNIWFDMCVFAYAFSWFWLSFSPILLVSRESEECSLRVGRGLVFGLMKTVCGSHRQRGAAENITWMFPGIYFNMYMTIEIFHFIFKILILQIHTKTWMDQNSATILAFPQKVVSHPRIFTWRKVCFAHLVLPCWLIWMMIYVCCFVFAFAFLYMMYLHKSHIPFADKVIIHAVFEI